VITYINFYGRYTNLATSLITQNNLVLKTLRESAVLTTSFVDSEIMNIQGANQVQLLVCFTKGNSTGCRLKVEFSEDQSTWYQESMTSEFPSANDVEHTLVARKISDTGNYAISIPVSASYLRASVQAVDSGDNTLLSVEATAANI
jgi:hypothetical protein